MEKEMNGLLMAKMDTFHLYKWNDGRYSVEKISNDSSHTIMTSDDRTEAVEFFHAICKKQRERQMRREVI